MIMRYAATAVIAAILGVAAVYAWLGPSMEVKTLNERLRALESDKLALEKILLPQREPLARYFPGERLPHQRPDLIYPRQVLIIPQ